MIMIMLMIITPHLVYNLTYYKAFYLGSIILVS